MTATACQERPEDDPGAVASAAHELAFLKSREAPRRASHAARMRQLKAELRQVPERDYVQAIDRWLDGSPWAGARWFFTTGRGLVVRLEEDGDDLTQEGVAIVSRRPIRLCDLPEGTRTSRRVEARALAAVAVRGDAGWYDGQPRRPDRPRLFWNGQGYAEHP